MFYVDMTKCRGCTLCTKVCGPRAISLDGGLACINPELCTECGKCLETCRNGAVLQVEVVEPTPVRSPVKKPDTSWRAHTAPIQVPEQGSKLLKVLAAIVPAAINGLTFLAEQWAGGGRPNGGKRGGGGRGRRCRRKR